MNLVKKVQNFSFQHKLWQKGTRIIIGVSGGPDSTCLLDVLSEIARKQGLFLHIVHVNYSLRKKDADRDESFVKKLAARYNLPLSIFHPQNDPRESVGNLEQKLRDTRYQIFERVRRETGFDLIATGHTLDDQAETVLMKIIRGTGLRGLRSITAKCGVLIRPLIFVSREEVLSHLKNESLGYRNDKTNRDLSLLRNRLRHKLIPYLEKNYAASIKDSLFSLSLVSADDYNYIVREASRVAQNIVSFNDPDTASFSQEAFISLHPALQRELIRLLAEKLEKKRTDLYQRNVEEVRQAISSQKKKIRMVSFGGLKWVAKGDKVFVRLN